MANLTPRLDRLERNQIHNGNFELWQRGTSTSIGSGAKTYLADRFACARSAFTIGYARSTDVPSGLSTAKYSAQLTSTGTSTATSRSARLVYHAEGFDWAQNIGKQLYLQFWCKASVVGTYGINLGFGGVEPTKFVQEFTISVADTWELKKILIPAVPSGAWDLESGIGCRIAFIASLGSDFNTAQSVGQWNASHLEGTAAIASNTWGSVNTHTFKIAQVMLLAVDSNFALSQVPDGLTFMRSARSFQEELAVCQRYFEKSRGISDSPGLGGYSVTIPRSTDIVSNQIYASPTFKVTKRTPSTTVVVYGSGDANTGVCFSWPTGVNYAANSAVVVGVTAYGFDVQNQSGGNVLLPSPQSAVAFSFTADAEF